MHDDDSFKRARGRAEAIAGQAIVPKRPGDPAHLPVFSLGPYMGRISFISQQIRALNLVWALFTAGKVRPGSRIAIVGGGLSGVTTALAFLAKGFPVTIYERARVEMVRQMYATHRFVHPHLNWWPLEDDSLNPATNLPFLNWFAGRCESVVQKIYSGGLSWKRRALPFPKSLAAGDPLVPPSGLELLADHEVVNFVSAPSDGGCVNLIVENRPDDQRNYDLVILACGFDCEATGDGFDALEYWDHDNLEKLRDSPNDYNAFIISGCGDGGLIDAARLAYRFSFGEMALKFALALQGTTFYHKIREGLDPTGKNRYEFMPILSQFYKLSKRPDYEALAAEFNEVRKYFHQPLQQRDEALAEAYAPLEAACRIIDENLLRTRELVHIVDGYLEKFWHGNAAPIYQFLIAIAKDVGVVVFHEHSVVSLAKGRRARSGAGGIRICDAKVVAQKNGNVLKAGEERRPFDAARTKVVVRHGAKSRLYNMGQMIPKRIVRQMEQRSEDTIDFDYQPAWCGDFFHAPNGFGCHAVNPTEYVVDHLKYVEKVLELLGKEADIQAHRIVRPAAIEGQPMDVTYGIEVICREEGYLPTRCFGIPIICKTELEVFDA